MIYSLTLLAGTVNAGKTAKVISKARNSANIPALAAVAFDSQQIISFEIAGKTRIDDTIAVKKDSVWHIGSDAKAMTATLIAILIEKKLLKWETTMSEIFPKLADDFHPNTEDNHHSTPFSHSRSACKSRRRPKDALPTRSNDQRPSPKTKRRIFVFELWLYHRRRGH